MSRIGKLPISIPSSVKITAANGSVSVEGPKGKLSKAFPSDVEISIEDSVLTVSPSNSSRFAKAMYGTSRAIINNMVKGVVEGYEKDIVISGVGFQAILQDTNLKLKLGYSHEIDYTIPAGITVIPTENGTKVKIQGADKQVVGQVAASIKQFYPVEPYKAKGVRIVGQHVIRKEGKTVA